ncbi:MAG: ATP-binding protein [Candidatus Cloacimonetes bacterium]|jgi:nitrogen fixation/metabolism regulation signal transduction histidine kinase|nr:ATP-binding protein [Candidatus Cloacimonadota bacterium]MDD4155059.1 ATP-binding protein [Candidatus Cloacimonadota bacterium]
MKRKMGFSAFVIIIFIIIFASSLTILNNYYTKKQDEVAVAFSQLRDSEEIFKDLELKTEQDRVLVSTLKTNIAQTLAGIKLIQSESRLYSSLMFFTLFLVSVIVFVLIITKLTKPLHELQKASELIKTGDFNVFIKPSGIKEVKNLINSFNEMSKELDNTQQKLLIAQKQLIWKDLSRILTHEIKNPLTPIQLTMQRLEEKFYSDLNKFNDIFPESLQLVYQEINNLQNLVTSFSTFAKDIQPTQTVFDPAHAINDIIKPYQQKYSIEINLEDNHRIKFDNTHFYQIITNIFQNAVESSSPEASIFISLEKIHSYVVLKIRDQGSGIAKEDLSRIFEPYFTKKSKGTGLGLALVKKLCDANHCIIRVKSKLREGTEFELIMEEVSENSDNR